MHEQLLEVLEPVMLDVCRASVEKHAGERFYSVALYTSGDYVYLVDSISTVQGLAKVADEYLLKKCYQDEWSTREVAMRQLKWSPADSPYHCEFDARFADVQEVLTSIWQAVDEDSDTGFRNTCRQIYETCVVVLKKVRDSDLFHNDQVVFNVLMGDQSDEARLMNSEDVNPGDVVDRYRQDLHIDDQVLAELRATRWTW